jgi:hypothetical protein
VQIAARLIESLVAKPPLPPFRINSRSNDLS